MKQVATDYRRAALDAATLALLDFAERATRDATRMTETDIRRLRDAGWSDEAILDDALGLAVNPEYATLGRIEPPGKV